MLVTKVTPMIDVAVSMDEPPRNHGGVLGVVEFGGQSRNPDLTAGHPTIGIAMRERGRKVVREVWTSASAVTSGVRDDIVYGHDGAHLFGAFRLPGAATYRAATRSAYRRMGALLHDLGYPHLVRMWNHIAGINHTNADGMEVYRDFCQGRAEGFEEAGTDMAAGLPAATGIGSRGDGVTVYFIAERSGAPVHFENPRQVPAHRYPREYGPRSPSFARATLLPASEKLFLSGTASIIGHRSTHAGDLDGQCDTTLENIRILLADVSEKTGGKVEPDSFTMLKAYVRHERDVPHVRRRLRDEVGPLVPLQLFTVDICRRELLLEVEGVLTMKFSGEVGGAGS
ncbi:FkbO/Hyg5 family chorismatase [Amycolatopsis kentuckyensis]|uniref:FkbO/Hyg5 family chorismatase n=1 Tax=Amycolatopsis kentuckyensis TaxID=218823 RepID=UPI000A3B3543